MENSEAGPIRSERAGERDLEERLETFLLQLGEQIDLVQEAESAGDWTSGARLARALAREAHALGFPLLARAAEHAASLCEAGDGAAAHKSIVELTEIVRRVRLGHRALV